MSLKEKLEAFGKINFAKNKPDHVYSKLGKVTLERLTYDLDKRKRQDEIRKIHRGMFPETPKPKEEEEIIKPVLVKRPLMSIEEKINFH